MRLHSLLIASALCLAPLSASRAQLAAAFALDITAAIEPQFPGEGASYAGVGFDGTYLWVTRWNAPRVTRLTPDGAYVDSIEIRDLPEIRSLSWDGSHFWASNNTTTLHRIDPVGLDVVATFQVANPVRYAAYDPTADGGNGGLWVGNFSTDLFLVDLSGNVLVTLPAQSLQYSARYGLAWDGSSEAGPVLRVFDQGGLNAVEVGAIELPGGTPRPAQDVFGSLASQGSTSALAGGLSFAPDYPGGPVLLALAQSVPNNIVLGLVPAAQLALFSDGFEPAPAP